LSVKSGALAPTSTAMPVSPPDNVSGWFSTQA
jgi:hypothetical protein